jgi:hypothetical protein
VAERLREGSILRPREDGNAQGAASLYEPTVLFCVIDQTDDSPFDWQPAVRAAAQHWKSFERADSATL